MIAQKPSILHKTPAKTYMSFEWRSPTECMRGSELDQQGRAKPRQTERRMVGETEESTRYNWRRGILLWRGPDGSLPEARGARPAGEGRAGRAHRAARAVQNQYPQYPPPGRRSQGEEGGTELALSHEDDIRRDERV